MLEAVLPIAIWLAIGAGSAVAGLISVVSANRRFRQAMSQVQPQRFAPAERSMGGPVSTAA